MLPVIHSDENWKKNADVCLRCGQHDARALVCRLGIDHQSHINSGYCPQGDFGPGSKTKPEVWPVEVDSRIQICRGCVACVKNHCGNDGATILAHARQNVCPMGNFGTMATLDTPALTAQPSGKGCCGGNK